MSVAATILDFYDDTDHELMTKVSMPVELRNTPVTMLTPEQHQELSDTDFGLIVLTKRASVLRKFPVNDPGNTWLSSQYFGATHKKLAFPARFVAAKFIKQACDAFGVRSSPIVDAYAARVGNDDASTNLFVEGSESRWMLRKLAEREFQIEKTAAVEIDAETEIPNEHFALVVRQGDGSVIRKYAMPDIHHVKMAAAYFDKYAMSLPPQYRHRFASAVQARAEELSVDVSASDNLEKWASPTWNRHVHAHLEQRKSLLPQNAKAREILDKLAASLEETTPIDAASALETFDRSTGLDRYYDRGVTDPYASTMEKAAQAWSSDIDGHTITETDLKKAASSKKLAGYLGETFARHFSEHPVEVFESLPSPEKILVKQIISGEA